MMTGYRRRLRGTAAAGVTIVAGPRSWRPDPVPPGRPEPSRVWPCGCIAVTPGGRPSSIEDAVTLTTRADRTALAESRVTSYRPTIEAGLGYPENQAAPVSQQPSSENWGQVPRIILLVEGRYRDKLTAGPKSTH